MEGTFLDHAVLDTPKVLVVSDGHTRRPTHLSLRSTGWGNGGILMQKIEKQCQKSVCYPENKMKIKQKSCRIKERFKREKLWDHSLIGIGKL